MLDHVSLFVRDMQRAKDFYVKALKPLGYELAMDGEDYAGFKQGDAWDFWLNLGEEKAKYAHIGFKATSEQMVKDFYDAALASGGKDNGPPGPRPDYGPKYYGGFVLDPEGNNIEATFHRP
ncbi:MAG: VOC family protein [Patescibacteria group bacterium]|jgi:catechol 2,3-dioxygenase-like lactoylglutathione lyase family enzyme